MAHLADRLYHQMTTKYTPDAYNPGDKNTLPNINSIG